MTRSNVQSIGLRPFTGGVLLLAIALLLAAFSDPAQFFRSYLFAWLYWLGLSLGGFSLVMLHHLVGGRWGFPVRRFFEAGLRTLPLLTICFLPLLFGLRHLYAWATPATVYASEILRKRHAYNNVPFFVIRMLIYFAVLIWMMRVLARWSRTQDRTDDPEPTRRLRAFSGPGLCLFFLVATLADVDLILSLEPDWYSTIFAAIVIVGNTLSTLALAIVLLALWREADPYKKLLSPEIWHHLGNLLLAFVMLWAYLSFSQFLIIYSGNLPQEIVWYLHRSYGGWKAIALLLGLAHFAIPFALLLSRESKRQPAILAGIAALVLVAHLLDVYWLVAPSFAPHHVGFHWQDICLVFALGGIWIGAFLHYLNREPLIPLNDPRSHVQMVA